MHWKEDLVSLPTATQFTFAFDTRLAALDTTTSWETLAHMIPIIREGFACSVGVFEGLKGIFAAGSVDYPTLPQRNSACQISTPGGALILKSTGGLWHRHQGANGVLVVTGGEKEIKGTEWVQTNNLQVVSIYYTVSYTVIELHLYLTL